MGRLSVNLCGIELDNPVIPASGTFGYGYEFAELYDINCLGTFSFKGTTREPHFGNPTPRIAECTNGLINSIGLQNPGVEKVISEELRYINNDWVTDEAEESCSKSDQADEQEAHDQNDYLLFHTP